MYTSVRNTPADVDLVEVARPQRRRRIAQTVVLLGLVSLVTDLSQEMVVAVLPLYLVVQMGLSPLLIGLIDGLYQGVTAALRLVGGLLADRRGGHKEGAGVGYRAPPSAQPGPVPAGG